MSKTQSNAPTFVGLHPPLRKSTLDVIQGLGFTNMTPVQGATIPLFLTNKDVAVEVRPVVARRLAWLLCLEYSCLHAWCGWVGGWVGSSRGKLCA